MGNCSSPGAARALDQSPEDDAVVETSLLAMGLLGASTGARRTVLCSAPGGGGAADPGRPKGVLQAGDPLDPASSGIGWACLAGAKPNSRYAHTNQDSWSVHRVSGHLSVYGVYDGHGRRGHEVSEAAKASLPADLLKQGDVSIRQAPALMRAAFERAQERVGKEGFSQRSGTTATVVLHDHRQDWLMVAHVGDSGAVLGRAVGSKMEAVQLTRDHKPELDDERQRIRESGGLVLADGRGSFRVYRSDSRGPGLNMSRSLGDLQGHDLCGLSAEPEILDLALGSADKVLLIGSDGLWDAVSPQEAVRTALRMGPRCAREAAQKIAREARQRWVLEGNYVDDITVLLIHLHTGDSAQDSAQGCPAAS
mmetsp:Transcript_39460/g.102863  ORF Transcript_39460/g.102863 Transcript_39460/m.102863 type:complete len:366 (-) Transcript_39460:264-1361(-)